jgi:signal transduction histidine kinase/ActR/RegA family two-component response regulator
MDVALLLESAVWPAFLVDPAGIIRRANKAAIGFFGPIVETQNTSLASILSGSTPSDVAKVLTQIEQAAPPSLALTFKTKDGNATIVPTFVCAFTREGEKRFLFQLHGQGQPVGAAAAKPDAAATTTAAAVAPVKQKVDRATQLARSVALDLNNTLTSIMGHCSWILGQMEQDHKWRKSMEEINRAASKSAEIAENLAAFSRSDKEKEATIASNVNALLRRLQHDFQQTMKDIKVQWDTAFEEQLYSARCDENKLLQVFTRVIENAVESGAVQPCITLHTRNTDLLATLQDASLRLQPGCYVCVEIGDNGKGIRNEILPRVFEPFFTTKPGHKGLGLAWVYGAVTNAGGGIAISSVNNQGTSVRLYIPAHKRVSRETAIVALKSDAGAGKTILLVDDEDLVLSVGQTVLSAYGYTVLTTTSAEKALDLLAIHQDKINLVIVDWVMPHISGKELMERIRAEYPGIAVLCTSGYAHVPGVSGNTDFLQKPFTTQKLLERVKDKLAAPPAAAAA